VIGRDDAADIKCEVCRRNPVASKYADPTGKTMMLCRSCAFNRQRADAAAGGAVPAPPPEEKRRLPVGAVAMVPGLMGTTPGHPNPRFNRAPEEDDDPPPPPPPED
jgi:hypothetical protein